MYIHFRTIQKLAVIFLLFGCTESVESTSDQLLNYWNRKIELSPTEQKEVALATIASSDDNYLKAIAHYITGNFSRWDKDNTTALAHYVQAEHHMSESGMVDDKLMGYVYIGRGTIARKHHMYKKAVDHYETALNHLNRFPDDFAKERTVTMYNQGIALMNIDYVQGLTHFEKLLLDSNVQTNIDFRIKLLRLIGEIHTFISNYSKAEISINEAIKLYENTNLTNQKLEAQLYQSLSRVYYYTGDYSKQETYLRQSLAVGVESKAFILNVDLGESLIEQGKEQEALTLLTGLEKDYESQPLNKDNIRLYELLSKASPNPSIYEQKEKEEQAKYEKNIETTIAKVQEDKEQLIYQQVADKNKQAKEKEAAERWELFWIIAGVVALLALLFFAIYYRVKNYRLIIRDINRGYELLELKDKNRGLILGNTNLFKMQIRPEDIPVEEMEPEQIRQISTNYHKMAKLYEEEMKRRGF